MKRLYLPLLCILAVLSCTPSDGEHPSMVELNDPFELIEDQQAKDVLQKAMAAMGGLERWNSKQRLSFTKKFKLFKEDGSIESDVSQRHSYTFKPAASFSIKWTNDEEQHEILQSDGKLSKTINGAPDTEANMESLKNTVLSSVFVVEIPFKVLDPGANISYAGKDTLDEGQIVDAIQVIYDPEAHSNHTTPDIWTLYFDAESAIMLAYMVQHADHISYVRNLSNTVVDGFSFVSTRDSWRVNEKRELLYLRATYEYRDYEMELDS